MNIELDIFTDNHIHTALCHHAKGTMEEYVLSAIAKKMTKITFLEHMEEGVKYVESTWLTETDFDFYFHEGHRLKTVYGNKIDIGLGVEVGYNAEFADKIIERLAKRNWDQIGISYHYAHHKNFDLDLNLVSKRQINLDRLGQINQDKLLDSYFDNLIDAVNVLPGTMLCHIDAALRHQQGVNLTSTHMKKLEQLLIAIKDNNMGLEINTSGFALRDIPYPHPKILKKAIELEIPLMCSSDSHKPEDIGRYFDRLPAYLNSALHHS